MTLTTPSLPDASLRPNGQRRVDVRPILPRSADNAWERTEQLRTDLYLTLERLCRAHGIEALVLQSDQYVHPAWVKFESWLPAGEPGVTARSAMTVTITTEPFRRFEAIYKVEWHRHGQGGAIHSLFRFAAAEAERLLECLAGPPAGSLVGRTVGRTLRPVQLRQSWWQFWKPTNKVLAVERDWAKAGSLAAVLIGVFLLIGQRSSCLIALVGAAVIALGVVGLIMVYRSPRLVRSAGKPLAEPRFLSYLDAWQTIVFEAGQDAESIRDRLMALFDHAEQQRFTHGIERIWHWGVDGWIEREQVVLRYGRGIVFCQVYSYGSDLYVGWNAHLNVGTWREKRIAAGIDRETGARVTLMAVEPATQWVGEYDLVDLNCLLESTHAQVTKVLRQYLKEREIDQEIDFTIIRGDRKDATRTDRKDGQPRRGLFKRTA